MSSEASGALQYRPELDGLRAIAVAAVLAFHGYGWRFPGGWVGVDVFFVLSGYLITRLLKDEVTRTGSLALGRFYARRFLRLTPAFWCLLGFASVLSAVAGYRPIELKSLLVSAIYVANFCKAFACTPEWALGHTWSLSAEEQFYLLWPPLFLVLRKRALWLLGSLLVCAVAWKAYLLSSGATSDRIYFGFDTHAEPLLIGCALALAELPRGFTQVAEAFWLAPVIALVLTILSFGRGVVEQQVWGFLFTGWLGAWLIIASSNASLLRILSTRPLVFTGRISYGLYLWHYPLYFVAKRHWPDLQPAVPLSAAYLMAVVSYFAIETPFLRIKRRFQQSGATPEPVSAHALRQ